MNRDDDNFFFAGIGAEDYEDDVDVDEDAELAETDVRPADDEPSGSPRTMPMLGAGAGIGGAGAVGLGAFAGGTRSEDKQRGVNAPVSGPVMGVPLVGMESAETEASGLHVDALGRLREDPWGVGASDDLPSAFTATGATDEAPRLRTAGSTRRAHNEQRETSSAPVAGAPITGMGSMQTTGAPNPAAHLAAPGTAPAAGGGVPLSVLQNLQTNKASTAAFAPPMPVGVAAAGATATSADPRLLLAQALAANGEDGPTGVHANEAWLNEQLRNQDVDAEGFDEDEESSDGGRKDKTVAAGIIGAGAIGGAGVIGGVGGGDQGKAPRSGDEAGSGAYDPTDPTYRDSANPFDRNWQQDTNHQAPTIIKGPDIPTGSKPLAPGGGFTPATGGGGDQSGSWTPTGGLPGVTPSGSVPGVTGVTPQTPSAPNTSGHWGAVPQARGTDFRASHDLIDSSAQKWHRLSEEMEDVHRRTKRVRDAGSTFGLLTEAVRPYAASTVQTQRWAAQAVNSFERLAGKLGATADRYQDNEHNAIQRTGRMFEL